MHEQRDSMETLWPKRELPTFFQLKSFVDKQLSIPTHYSICYAITILDLNPLILTKWEWDG